MNSRTLAPLLLVVGIAIGFGAAVLVMGGGEEAHGSSAAPITREEADGSGGAGGNELAAPGALPRAAAPGGIDSAAASDARTVLSRAAESARVAAAAAEESGGAGSFRGVVRDTSGAPVAGAVVVVAPARPRRDAYDMGVSTSTIGRAWDGHWPIETYYLEPMTQVLEERRQTRTVTTDGEGRFAVDRLRAGRYGLTAHAEGFQGERVEANTGAEVELVVTPITAFEIDPRLPDGTQPERAVVELEAEGRRRAYTWTRDESSVRIPVRVAKMRVLAGETAMTGRRSYTGTYSSEQRTVDLDEHGVGPHVFELAATPLVQVTMVGEDGRDPMETAWIQLGPSDGEARELARVDETTFVLTDVTPGAYTVTAGEVPGAEALSEPISVTEGLNELRLALPAADPREFLVIRCVDGNGLPVERVSFTAGLPWPDGRVETHRVDPAEHGRGEWWLPWSSVTDRRGEPASFELTATTDTSGSVRASVAPGQTSVRLEFLAPCQLVVEVEGRRAAGVFLDVQESDRTSGLQFSLSVRVTRSFLAPAVPESGRLEVGRVQPGRYRLALLTSSSRWSSMPLVEREVVLGSGPQTVSLTLPPLHDLTVVLPEKGIGESIYLEREREGFPGGQLSETVGADGRVTFHELTAGEYRILARSPSWWGGEMRVTVPCGIVEFTAAEEFGVEILAFSEGAPLAASALQPGDIILEFDGKSATEQSFWPAFASALTRGPVEVRLLRGGTERAVTVELGEMGPQGHPTTGLTLRTALR